MKIRSLLLLAAAALMATGAFARSESGGQESTADSKAAPKPAPVLKKGMTEAQVVAALGRPQQVKPMKVPAGTVAKAETWVYRVQVGTRATQVATGTRQVPAFRGLGMGNDQVGTAEEIVYSTKYIKVFAVTSVLMIDGKLEQARQKTETEDQF